MDSKGSLFKWLTLPPVVAILTILGANAVRSVTAAVPVDPSVWGMTGLLFIILSVIYGLFIMRDFNAGLLPLQVTAQGILLCPLSLSVGARMLQWLGVTMAVCGAVVLTVIYNRQHPLSPLHEATVESEELKLPILFAVTDEAGTILSVSDAMLEAAGLSREEAEGQSITALLTPGDPTAQLGGRTWNVVQQPLDDGHYYFQLEEPQDSAPQAPAPASASFVDPETRLYTLSYAMTQLEEELYRTQRYNRPLTTILMRFAFPADAENDASVKDAFNIYCGLVSDKLRTSDTVALAGPHTILAVLPECPAGSAVAVVEKMLVLMSSVSEAYPAFKAVAQLHVTASFEGKDDLPDARGLLEQLNRAMDAKYTLRT